MDYNDKSFNGEEVYLDDNRYIDCSFHNCTLIYGGGESGGFSNCQFSESKWGFNGSASNTIEFLTFLYQQMDNGGRASVEYIFEKIRSNQ